MKVNKTIRKSLKKQLSLIQEREKGLTYQAIAKKHKVSRQAVYNMVFKDRLKSLKKLIKQKNESYETFLELLELISICDKVKNKQEELKKRG